MPPPRPRSQWQALRALSEGAPPTYEVLGAASQLHPNTIARKAAKQGWAKPSFQSAWAREDWMQQQRVLPAVADGGAEEGAAEPGSADGAEPVGPEQLRDFINSQKREIMARSAGGLSKADSERLMMLMRIGEKLDLYGSVAPVEERPTDEEIAEVLQRINERIIELAREFAREFPDRLLGEELSGVDGKGS